MKFPDFTFTSPEARLRFLVLLALYALGWWFSTGCVRVTAVSTAPSGLTYPVSAIVYAFASTRPLVSARVQGELGSWPVDAAGHATVSVPANRETCLRAVAPGYHPFEACGTVGWGRETWAFYLQPEDN